MSALFGVLGIVIFIVGLVLLIVWAIKKKSKKVPLILIVIGIVLFIIGIAIPSPKPVETPSEPKEASVTESEPVNEPVQEEVSEETAEAPTEDASEDNSNKTWYLLDAEDPTPGISEYITFNEGTEFEDQALVFHLEPGTYEVSNIGSYPSGFNVYVDGEKNVTEEGWEEWVSGDAGSNASVPVGETIEVEVPEGYVVHLDPPAKFQLVQK